MHDLNSLEMTAEQRRKRGRFWIPLSIVWFIVLINPFTSLFDHGLPIWRIALALIGLAAFIGIYFLVLLSNVLHNGRGPIDSRNRWQVIGALTAIAVALTIAYGAPWMLIFVFVNSATGVYLPTDRAVKTICAVSAIAIASGVIAHANLETLIGDGLTVIAVGFLMWSFTNVIIAYRELRTAREGLAKLAVAEERLRFARDLHDLLGHNLSVIALKSELAGKLAANEPERAVKEINEIEAVARKSLHDIREAVSGYRQPTIDVELRGAHEILAAAGISLEHDVSSDIPAEADAPFAWAIREGVTNVIRHSRAHRCAIRLGETAGGTVALEISDDGVSTDAISESGSGLAGLRERFAAIGGTVEATAMARGGFRLTACVPVKRPHEAALR